MELLKTFQLIQVLLASTLLLIPLTSINGQISSPCTSSMITSFTPCLNFITGSSNNGTSPTTSCCGSLKSLMANGMDCACLLITANVPVQLPINRTLALSLPRACKIAGVPIQCKSSGTPLPAPGPVLMGPSPLTIAPSPFSPRASKVLARAPAPQPETNVEKLTPVASPPVGPGHPTKTAGIRPVLTPPASSSSTLSSVFLPSILQLIVCSSLGFIMSFN